jgi:uncharacterized protein (TIGR02246 family)
MTTVTDIRTQFEDWADGIRAKDLKRVMAHYADEVESFDVVDPLRYSGKKASRERTEKWFASFESDIGLEVLDLTVLASETVGFSYSLNRYTEKVTGKDAIDMWVRVTFCWENADGKWLIVHQHNSVPFNPETGKASLEIQPELKSEEEG